MEPFSAKYCIYIFITILAEAAVPLFWAVSGACLLNKDESVFKVLKRVARIVVIIVIVSFIYYLNDVIMSDKQFRIKEFIWLTITDNTCFHLWYLYAYIGFLLLLPFLRSIAKHISLAEVRYLLALNLLVVVFIPFGLFLIYKQDYSINHNFISSLWMTNQVVIFPLIGYFCEQKPVDEIKHKDLAIILGTTFLAIIIVIIMVTYRASVTGVLSEQDQTFLHDANIFIVVAVFLAFKKIGTIKVFKNKTLNKGVNTVGEAVFGIYLFHMLVKYRNFSGRFYQMMTNMGINEMVSVWVYCLFIALLSFVITYMLRLIPFIRKFI